MRLPEPMLAQSAALDGLAYPGYGFEAKYDGFRAIIGLNGGLFVRSRRGWNLSSLVPELAAMPVEGVLDGEFVVLDDQGRSDFPALGRRLLHGERSIRVTFVAFDVLEVEGESVTEQPYRQRRRRSVGEQGRVECVQGECFLPRCSW